MKRCQQIVLACFLVSVAAACGNRTDEPNTKISIDAIEQPAWALLPFEKMDSVNPVLTPGESLFLCPIRNDTVQWEEKDVFNPATVVRNDTLLMIYRAEDSIGKFAGTS